MLQVCVTLRDLVVFFFFFQAEDGIRDADVTGVQTCALPICGKDVVWLRQRLGEVEGDGTPARGDPVYDEELKRRVIAFQQVESLTPDGIVGEETLVRLAAARVGAGVPSLSRARPESCPTSSTRSR